MSPFQISLGIAFRLLASLFLIFYSLSAIAAYGGTHGYLTASIFAIVGPMLLANPAIKLYRQHLEARFGIASIIANASMAICIFVHILFAQQMDKIIAVGIGLVAWFSFMTWRRYRQFKSGSYYRRFEPRAKLPSPFAILKNGN